MNGNTVSIHQPNYLPYLGYFDKMKNSDTFVILDNVQFVRTGEFAWQHRNRIRTQSEWMWLTIPVVRDYGVEIKDVKIANQGWQEKHWKAIEANYRRTLCWETYSGELETFFTKKYNLLVEINIPLIKWMAEKMGIEKKILIASEMDLDESLNSTDLLIEIIKKTGGKKYISGKFGQDYLDKTKFQENDIELIIQNFVHPVYKQKYEGFVPNLSAIDFLFNVGGDSFKKQVSK